jgi:hypothetical protein
VRAGQYPPRLTVRLPETRTAIARPQAIGYAAITAIELAYLLRMNLPQLWPPTPCGFHGIRDMCVLAQPPFPWPWIALAALLLLSAVAVLLRKTFGVAMGFVGQGLVLLPLLRDTVNGVGSFLFTGSGYDGIDPDYRDLAFTFLALAIAVGPAFTLLLTMSSRRAVAYVRAARIAAVLLGGQLMILAVAAVVVFRATLHDCEFYGGNPPTADGVPWCTPASQIDLSPVLITILPTAAVLLAVVVGVWLARHWAVAGGIVWQVLLALILVTLGVALWNQQSQNAWFDHFPSWTSPRQLTYALMVTVPMPTLAALLAAGSTRVGNSSVAETLAAARD